MFEWRVTVRCPARLGNHQRVVSIWTEHDRAVDARHEARRLLREWPGGARPVDVEALGLYVPAMCGV